MLASTSVFVYLISARRNGTLWTLMWAALSIVLFSDADVFSKTSTMLIKDTLAGRKNTSPANQYEIGQLYSAGALKIACVGLQCVGFNVSLYRTIMEQATKCQQNGRWKSYWGAPGSDYSGLDNGFNSSSVSSSFSFTWNNSSSCWWLLCCSFLSGTRLLSCSTTVIVAYKLVKNYRVFDCTIWLIINNWMPFPLLVTWGGRLNNMSKFDGFVIVIKYWAIELCAKPRRTIYNYTGFVS